jgi:hypothetical protein
MEVDQDNFLEPISIALFSDENQVNRRPLPRRYRTGGVRQEGLHDLTPGQ